jgi:tellurite resistance protein TerC
MTQSIGTALFWSVFLLVVIVLLAVDLGVFHRKAHPVGVREALIWSIVWVILSLSFGMYIYWHWGAQRGLEFFAGYVLEKAMSVDNIFVFVLIFSFFNVPARLHHRVLYWGILGALIMRGIFIFGGALLIQTFHWVLYLFGGFLIFTGVKILRHGGTEVQPERNPIVRWFQRFVPMVAGFEYDGLLVRKAGKILATPLALVLVTVETTDLVFAVDSIPAIFGVTRDPFIVYSSNVCAILGLRAMYFLLAAVLDRFVYLGVGLGIVLMFIGAKMLLADVFHLPISAALGVIALVLGISVVYSLLRPERKKAAPSKTGNSLIR